MTKSKQKVVRTSRMYHRLWNISEDIGIDSFVCIKLLCRFLGIGFPRARHYWLAASPTQWEDRTGTAVWFERSSVTASYWASRIRGRRIRLRLSEKTLARLIPFIPKTHTPTKLFVRLEYEV